MSEIAAWLEKMDLGKYEEVFAENEIDFDVLPELTEAHLKDIGIPLGPRLKLVKAIAALKSDTPAATETLLPAEDAIPAATVTSSSQAERRQLTVMFVDLVGSTALSGQLDPEDLSAILHRYQDTASGEINRLAGYVARFMGDGILAYFGWPRALEDAAERAVRAGLAITAEVARLRTPDNQPLTTRCGIATGLVVVGELIGEGSSQEQVVVGETPNLAARLQGLASPGTVVVGDSTRRLLGELFELENMGPQTLKGIAAPTEAYTVVRERPAESRYQAQRTGALLPMMGRDNELAQLLEGWRQVRESEGQMILVTGEAGIGKSCLLRALDDALNAQSHYRIHYQCSPYHVDSALYPVLQQLTRAAGFDIGDSDDTRLDKLEALLGLVADESAQNVPLIADLLGIDGTSRYGALKLTPQQQRPRTLQALVAQLTGLARDKPVLFVIEDAHWIDPTTLALIEQVLDVLSRSRVLLLITARPTFEHHFGGHPSFTRLVLNRLGREPAIAIIERLSGGKALPEELVNEIIRKTDGMPLFVEEITKTVLESGQLRAAGDVYVLDAPLRTLDIPSSLNDSLMARLDRLQPVREVTQMAACIGREFGHRLLAQIALVDTEKLQTALNQLIDAELVFRRGTPPDASYTFKHALVRDAAYSSLLNSKRQQIHARLLAALESMSGPAPELLARHATEAGLIEPAIRYWQQAGEQSIQRSANAEAFSQLSQAIELLARLPESVGRNEWELDLQTTISAALIAAEGFSSPQVAAANERAYALCQQMGQTPKIISPLCPLQRYYSVTGQLPRALEVSREAYRLLKQFTDIDPAWNAVVNNAMGATAMQAGEFVTAWRFLQEGVELSDIRYRETQILFYGEDMGITCRGFLAIVQWCSGYPDQARHTLMQARARAEQFSHSLSIAWTKSFALFVFKYLDSAEAVHDQATANHAFAVEQSLPSFQSLNLLFKGWAGARQNQSPSALEQIEQIITLFEHIGFRFWGGFFRSLLAEAHQVAGQIADALRLIDEAMGYTDRIGEEFFRAELYRLKGEFLLQQAGPDAADAAQACFQQSLDIARKQQAKGWELRATMSLARLWYDQSRPREARELLTPVYEWFTEGFETPDLQDARTLLDELA